MSLEESIKIATPTISNTLNAITIASSLVVLIIYATIAIYRHELVNRVTLRLQVAVSLFDFLNSFFAMFHHAIKSGPFCIFQGFWRSFGGQMYCFMNIAIAVNLQLIFIHGLLPSPKWEIFYWIIPLIIAGAMSIVPFGLDLYGMATNNLCFIKEEQPGAKVIITLNTTATFMATFFYLLIVCTIVVIKLNNDKKVVISMSHFADSAKFGSRATLVKEMKQLILRISLYPLACLFSLSGFIVGYIILVATNKRYTGISLWGTIGITSKGFFNLITFLLDPTVQKAIIATYRGIFGKKVNDAVISPFNSGISTDLATDNNTSHSYNQLDGSNTTAVPESNGNLGRLL